MKLWRVRAVVWKDFTDLKKNRALWLSLLALPAVIVIAPVGIIHAYVNDTDQASLRTIAAYYSPDLQHGAARFLIDKVLSDWLAIFLMMPVFVPILISAHAIAGEKERRTLEPLLASPITATELVMGKSLASLLPALAICFLAFAVLCVAVNVAAWPLVGAPLLPNRMWVFGMVVLAPAMAVFGNGVAVLISARVGDARLAQQLSGLFVLPLVGIAAGQFAGVLTSGPLSYAILAAVVVAADVAVFALARRVFDTERLLTRWG